MPPNFGKQSIKFNTMIDNLRRSKLVIESGSFAAWRARREGGGSSSAAPAEEGSEEGSEKGSEEEQAPRKSPRKLAQPPTAEGSDDGDDGDDSDYVASEGGVPLEEMPYAAGNVCVPPGGQDPVSCMDQQLQLSEQLSEPGGQAALEGGFGDGHDDGPVGASSARPMHVE